MHKLDIKQLIKKYVFNLYVLVFFIFIIPRIIGLGSDIANYDSSYWHPRIDEFKKAIPRGELKGSYQKYHPGVTILWLSGTSKLVYEKTFETVFKYNPNGLPQQFIRLHFASKLPLVLLISLIGVAQFFIIRKIAGVKQGLIFAVILSLEPFFLGVSRFLHLSALTSMLMFLSFLLVYYNYYIEDIKRKYLYISAIMLGLGILTKVDAVIALPINGLLILFYEYSKGTRFLEIMKVGFLYGLILFLTFFLLFPAMWVSPYWVITRMYNEGIKDTAFSSSGAETLSGIKLLFYPEMIIFRSMPSTIYAFIAGIFLSINYFIHKPKGIKMKSTFFMWVLFYILFNFLILTIPDKIKDRYLINLYPAIMLISAVTFWYLIFEIKYKAIRWITIVALVLVYSVTIYRYHPVYSFYYSDLIGGAAGRDKFGLSVKNRGEYYAQVAQYINNNDSNPSVRNVILSHREQMRTFRPYFYGATFTNPSLLKEDFYADYIITRPDYDHLVPFENCKLEKAFGPKDPFGYDIIKLYKCEGITNEYKDFRN